MTTTPSDNDDAADAPPGAATGLWPSADYGGQVERLRAAVGETVYVAELNDSATQLGVQISDRAVELLGVLDFPRPDPARGLAPHLILLDDGRGINLGRVARISRRPFQPARDELLYLDATAYRDLLFADRRLSKGFIGDRGRATLGQLLGYAGPQGVRPEGEADRAPDDEGAERGAR